MISISGVKKSFGSQVVLDGIDCEIASGEMIAVVGPSGTGKSVLLKIITGLMPADSGEVVIGKDSMTGASSEDERMAICRRMGVLFQSAALFDSLSLLENVAFPLHAYGGCGRDEIYERAWKSIDDVELRAHAHHLPGEVSIGMRKRAGIARALITNPEIILFDEPNTGLDPYMGQEIYDLINLTHKTYGFTGIVISHEIPEVFQVCHRVVMLYKGRVQYDGEVDNYLDSDNEAVKQFVAGDIHGPISMG